MNITIVCDVLGRENNGTTIAAMNLIRSLKSKGHRVTVVCPDEGQSRDDGYEVVKKMNLGPFNGYVEKVGVCIAAADDTVITRAVSSADVVHFVTPFLLAHKALRIALEHNIPITASFHCQAENITSHLFMMNSAGASHLIYKFFYDSFYRYCDAVHYPTQFICDVFESDTGHTTNHYVISNGVNKRFIRKSVSKPADMKDKFIVLFTGRYGKEKSHSVLIDAVALSKHSGDIQLIFAGAGPLEQKLRRLSAEKLKNQPVFKFFSREEMLDVLNYSDLYVHPAEVEIEAIACLEAICCGLVPVIADSPRSATRGFALTENNLFEHNNPESLAEKIDWWIEHPEERESCRLDYEGYARRFDQDACMDAMEKMLTDTVRDKHHDPSHKTILG